MTPAMLTKVIINLAIFLIIGIGSIIFLKKIKTISVEVKWYRYLFILYTCFWIAPMMLRSYAGTMQKAIDANYVAIALASYGIIGIFIRPLADILSFSFKSRKSFLYIACISQIICYIPIIIAPNTITSIIQSIGVGIGASCIGTFQLFAKEQTKSIKGFEIVSLLSIPPLLANFLTAPLQSIVMIISKQDKLTNPDILKYMWLIGLIFTLLAIILIIFLREEKQYFGSCESKIFNWASDGYGFISLCIIGSIITFVKFSNSGSVGTLHLQTLGDITNNDVTSYEGYLSVIFSLFQLIGGILVGSYLVKYLNFIYIFGIGIITWIIYMIGSMFILNPIGYFAIHGLNGFGYGILYNFVLGSVLTSSFSKAWITPMGIYQSILSIGIAISGIFTQMIKINMQNNFLTAVKIINGILIVICLIAFCIYALYWKFNIKQKNFWSKHQSFKIFKPRI